MRLKLALVVLSLLAIKPANAGYWESIKEEFVSQNEITSSTSSPGFVITVSTPNQIELVVESGAADIEQRREITRDTVFHIASLSKQITAATLAHAIIQGKVSLEDPISKWVPETNKYGSDLKIKHLAYMTSGLTEYMRIARADQKPWATFHYFSTADAIQASLSVDRLLFEPGEKWQYSNINYMLITEIISNVYGKPFSVVVHEEIFVPLGMSSSLINDDITQIIPNRANAYLMRTRSVITELKSDAKIYLGEQGGLVMVRRNSPHYGGSGVMTSMNDWLKWQNEMMTQKVFGAKFWQTMLATMKFDHDKTNDALGLVHGVYEGKPSIWYDGGDIDTSSYSITFPDNKINISCFSNNPLDSCRVKTQTLIKIISQKGWPRVK